MGFAKISTRHIRRCGVHIRAYTSRVCFKRVVFRQSKRENGFHLKKKCSKPYNDFEDFFLWKCIKTSFGKKSLGQVLIIIIIIVLARVPVGDV